MPSKGSWGKTQEAMEDQGQGTFLRLVNDGDKAVVAFCGAPFHRDICFNEKTNAYEAWDDGAKAAGRKKTSRYAMNAYCISLNGKDVGEMRVVDMNFTTMQQVIALKDKYTLGKYLFEIARHGAKGDTKTTYAILPDKEITAEHRALFGSPDPKSDDNWNEGSVPLLDLEETTAKGEDASGTQVTDDVKKDGKGKTNGTAGASKPATPPASGASGSAASITKEVAAELIEKLKPLPKEKGIQPFMARFPYAKKVSEVHASDEAAARALVIELSGGGGAPAAEDPFA